MSIAPVVGGGKRRRQRLVFDTRRLENSRRQIWLESFLPCHLFRSWANQFDRSLRRSISAHFSSSSSRHLLVLLSVMREVRSEGRRGPLHKNILFADGALISRANKRFVCRPQPPNLLLNINWTLNDVVRDPELWALDDHWTELSSERCYWKLDNFFMTSNWIGY